MHTHFGSALNGLAAFLTIVVVGTFWRLFWMHTMAFAIQRNINALAGFARAALAQY